MSRASSPLSHDELVASGRDALFAGDHARARELLDTAVRLDPNDAEAWAWLGGAQTEPAEMAACFNRALALDPESYQAHEGLRWLAQNYGDELAYGHPERPAPAVAIRSGAPGLSLAQAAVYPFAAGALLGLTRLVGWLRPETLVALRLDGSALGFGGALLLAVAAAVAHGAALVLAWGVLGAALGAARAQNRGDTFDSLQRAGTIWEPGLVWGAALGIVAFGLVFAPLVWPAVALLCWVALIVGVILIAMRLRGLFRSLGVAPRTGLPVAAACAVAAVLGCWLAGLLSAALL